ncbi:hypothetical protein B0T25DRAFT_598950 [Lasiosphaeria hispida]|uniref:Uncharacterized protein n=1 Tax=Lasiosphaeria hispida TaxID=260671 RepID=A0AAJ0ML92_9PEZI|nr:hypothetical protein B0T25DRAFT_598950 [Lasiosphaeria hispida]
MLYTLLANEKMGSKHYFLPPIPEAPPDGPIRLGSIIATPQFVFEPVNSYPVSPSSCFENVFVYNTGPGHISLEKTAKRRLGVFAELPAFVNAALGTEWPHSSSESWTYDNLRTVWFTPPIEYVRQSVEDTQVQNFVNDNKSWLGRINLYMVTSLKIAYGASVLSDFAKSYGFNGQVGIDLSTLGAPVVTGPEGGFENGFAMRSSSSSADAVVFAFRLRRIKIRPMGDPKQEDYTNNALLGEKRTGVDARVDFGIDGVDDDDVTGAAFGIDEKSDAIDETPAENPDGEGGEEEFCSVSKAETWDDD